MLQQTINGVKPAPETSGSLESGYGPSNFVGVGLLVRFADT